MIIRKAFPQVYALRHPTKGKYWLASARSKKWGMNERKTFTNEQDALDYAKRIDEQITQNGRQPDLPAEKLQAARSYENLIVKLATYGRTPEEAAEHFLRHLGSEAARQAKGGKSYVAIAEQLNADSVKPRQGQKWHPTQVQRIIQRAEAAA